MALTGTCRNASRSGGSTGLAAGAILSIGSRVREPQVVGSSPTSAQEIALFAHWLAI